MSNLYIPYSGRRPAAVSVKGHRFLILSRERGILEAGLQLIGADGLRSVETVEKDDEEDTIDELAEQVNGSVLGVPEEVTVFDILDSLQSELPWLH